MSGTMELPRSPWTFSTSGAPGGNGHFNLYVSDGDGRKIVGVYGKRGEQERLASAIVALPILIDTLEAAAIGLREASRVLDIALRGGDAREADIHANNCEAVADGVRQGMTEELVRTNKAWIASMPQLRQHSEVGE
jgi:hypothetical protein